MLEDKDEVQPFPIAEASVGDLVHVDRDYTIRHPTFPTAMPSSLASRLSASQFSHTVEVINTVLFEATQTAEEDATWRSLLSCLLLHLVPRFWPPPERALYQRLNVFIAKENERTYAPVGLELRNPLLNGFLFVRSCHATSLRSTCHRSS